MRKGRSPNKRWGWAEWLGLAALLLFFAFHPKALLAAIALAIFAAILFGLF